MWLIVAWRNIVIADNGNESFPPPCIVLFIKRPNVCYIGYYVVELD